MGIASSTYYDAPKRTADDAALVETMHAIKDEFEPPRVSRGSHGCPSRLRQVRSIEG